MCTASGRKAAQAAGTVERRSVGRMVDKSKFVGGKAGLYKSVSISGATKQAQYNAASSDRAREEQRLGSEAGTGSTWVDPRKYGGSSYDTGGEGSESRAQFSGKASSGVSGMTWTGASGRKYQINRNVTERDFGSEAGTVEYSTDYSVGARNRLDVDIEASSNYKPRKFGVKNMSGPGEDPDQYKNWNVGANKKGIDIGKTEEEARATYKDFGMDFDKDEYRGAFYKTTRGLANQQRQNTQGKEGALRKIHRIRNNGGPNTTGGNQRRKLKKQGNLRINSGGLQGGSTGGGTTLS